MEKRHYNLVKWIAIVLTLGWLFWSLYHSASDAPDSERMLLESAAKQLEDQQPIAAITDYQAALKINPESLAAVRGMAQAEMQMGARQEREALIQSMADQTTAAETAQHNAHEHYWSALMAYNDVIDRERKSGINDNNRSRLGVSYANRGILKDRMGDYSGALSDYQQAMDLEPEVREGPGFLTRFMRNQAEVPPTVADRATYLQQQLSKPESERRLRRLDEDLKQRSYKM
ncbi:MAG: hypothetical protein GY696_10030 [Gammaproteobacteria bacterium]|nr:hypothetical protein [Gammaproteobacteria bacterium]